MMTSERSETPNITMVPPASSTKTGKTKPHYQFKIHGTLTKKHKEIKNHRSHNNSCILGERSCDPQEAHRTGVLGAARVLGSAVWVVIAQPFVLC
jgi:hypothetical protein